MVIDMSGEIMGNYKTNLLGLNTGKISGRKRLCTNGKPTSSRSQTN